MGITYIATFRSFGHWYLLLASSNSISMVYNAGVKLFSGFKTETYIVNFSAILITLIFGKTCFFTCQNRYALHTLQ